MIVKQSGHIGDLIYSLTATKRVFEVTGEQVDFHVGFNVLNRTPNHPSGKYTMTDATYAYLEPLLLAQPYIKSVIADKHKLPFDYDFDKFRDYNFNLGGYDLRKWHMLLYSELQTDNLLSEKCIFVERKLPYLEGKIVVNLTERYRGRTVDYGILKPFESDVVFVGYENEFEKFSQQNKIYCKHLRIKEALHMAEVLNSCTLFIGNQSSTFAIAEQMKINRALEVYNLSPNVITTGKDYITTDGLKNILNQL